MKKLIFIISTVLLSACAHFDAGENLAQSEQQTQYIDNMVMNEINGSMISVKTSLNALNRSNISRFGEAKIPFANIKDRALMQKLSLSYYGPFQNVLKTIGETTNYQIQYFGKKWPFPIIVIVGQLNTPMEASALNMLGDIAVQIAKRASMNINTEAKVISIRYL